jgi:hypothetical protein
MSLSGKSHLTRPLPSVRSSSISCQLSPATQKPSLQATSTQSEKPSFLLFNYTGMSARARFYSRAQPSFLNTPSSLFILCFEFLRTHASHFMVPISKHPVKAPRPDGHDAPDPIQKHNSNLFRPPQMLPDRPCLTKHHLARDSNSTRHSSPAYS